MSDRIIRRSAPLIDFTITEGRVVTAYAATFADPYEVSDQHGHYYEQINPRAFNRTIGRGLSRIVPLFNHGRTIDGTPSDRFSLPLGVPLEVRPDAKGLVTVTRYSKTPLGDEVLELWRDDAITAQSFQGAIYPLRDRTKTHDSGLPLVERMELGLRDYGPAPFAVNTGAQLVGIRSQLLSVDVEDLTDEERADLLRVLQSPGPSGDPSPSGDPVPDPATTTVEPADPDTTTVTESGPSAELLKVRNEARRRRAAA